MGVRGFRGVGRRRAERFCDFNLFPVSCLGRFWFCCRVFELWAIF